MRNIRITLDKLQNIKKKGKKPTDSSIPIKYNVCKVFIAVEYMAWQKNVLTILNNCKFEENHIVPEWKNEVKEKSGKEFMKKSLQFGTYLLVF